MKVTYRGHAKLYAALSYTLSKAMNNLGEEGIGLWDDHDKFFYDVLHTPDGRMTPLKVRSMVGLIPLFAVENLEQVSVLGGGPLPLGVLGAWLPESATGLTLPALPATGASMAEGTTRSSKSSWARRFAPRTVTSSRCTSIGRFRPG